VVTTRRRDGALHTHGTVVEVDLFTPAEADAYLTEKFDGGPGRLVGAGELAADLGYLPGALAQAAAYIADQDITCADYRARFADRARTLDEIAPDALPDAYARTVAATLSLSVDAANRLKPVGLAKPLLVLLSLLDPNAIPWSVVVSQATVDYLSQHRDPVPIGEPGVAVDVERAGAALACLTRLHLATV